MGAPAVCVSPAQSARPSSPSLSPMPRTFPPFLRKPVAGAMMLVAAGAAPSHALAAPAIAGARSPPPPARSPRPPGRSCRRCTPAGRRSSTRPAPASCCRASTGSASRPPTRSCRASGPVTTSRCWPRSASWASTRSGCRSRCRRCTSKTINGVDFSNGKNAALQGVTPLEAMKIIVKQAARDHLMVLLDNHSDANNGYTEPLWYGERLQPAGVDRQLADAGSHVRQPAAT